MSNYTVHDAMKGNNLTPMQQAYAASACRPLPDPPICLECKGKGYIKLTENDGLKWLSDVAMMKGDEVAQDCFVQWIREEKADCPYCNGTGYIEP